MYLKELTNEEFNKFTQDFIQSSIYQTTNYGLIMNKQGFDSLFVGLIDDTDKIIGASLILIQKKYGFKYAYAPRGFLIDYTNEYLFETFTKLIKKYLGKKDIIAIKICPMIIKSIYDKNYNLIGVNKNYESLFSTFKKFGYYHLGYNNYFESLKPRFECVLDISKPYYELFKNFKRGTKNKIRSSIRNGVKIYEGTKEQLQELYLQVKDDYPRGLNYLDDSYNYFNDKIKYFYAKLSTEEYLKVVKKEYEVNEKNLINLNNLILNKNVKKKNIYINKKIIADKNIERNKKNLVEATNLLRDNPNGINIAGALIIKERDIVYIYLNGINKKLKRFNGNHLLIWSIIEKYSKEGYKLFNLGGITNISLEDNNYKGLNDFKSSFGANTYEYIGDFELITNTGLYFMYKNAAPIRSIFEKKSKK